MNPVLIYLSLYLTHISAGVDYIPIDVSLTFGADVRQKSINVTLINDGFDELDELFNVRIMIMTSANVFINMPLESVTILDEDGEITVSNNLLPQLTIY